MVFQPPNLGRYSESPKMSAPSVMQSDSPWAGPIAGALTGGLISGIFGLIMLSYGSQINAAAANQANIAATQSNTLRELATELREHDQKITTLEASDQARRAQDDRTAKAIGDIQASQGTIGEHIINVRNATDEANRRLDALQKSFDGVIDIVRPARAPGQH